MSHGFVNEVESDEEFDVRCINLFVTQDGRWIILLN